MEQKFDSAKRTKPIKHLVIHSFALTPEKMLNTLNQYGLSVHYMIDAKGKIFNLVSEDRVAWHAGPCFWAGETGLNWTSVGIELEHPQYGQTDYPKEQIEALTQLAQGIVKRYKIRPENIVAHSDIAPEAKTDPGRGFPWKELAANGIGLWHDEKEIDKTENLTVSELLSTIGYPTKGRALEASSWAFRQRFMPEVVPFDEGIAEREQTVFHARQQASKLPPKEQEKFLATAPTIYPKNNGSYLTDSNFIKKLRMVACQYRKVRNT